MATTVAGSSLAKHLASCNKTTRDKTLRLLKIWLPSNPSLPEDEMKKIWKGLFYCVWHADKQQFQLELINSLSSLLLSLNPSLSVHYFSTFVLTIRREWSGIDYLRLDKFYLLIRRFMHNMFAFFKKNEWDLELVSQFMCVLEEKTFLSNDKFPAQGVNYHIAEVFVQELKPFLPVKVEVVEVLVKPFVSVMGKSLDKVLLGKIKSGLFGCLLENGKKCLERKKGGSEDGGEESKVDEVELLGTIALTLGFSKKFFELGSSEDCVQGNRKVLFGLNEEYAMLEKDIASLGVKVSIPEVNNVGDDNEVPQLIPITQGEVGESDKPSKKKIKKVKRGIVSEQENQVANGSMDKPSKKSKKEKKAVVEQVTENQTANGSIDKPSKKIKKDKKAVVVTENQVADGSMDKKSKKINKDKNASGGSGSKKSKKRRDSSEDSAVSEGDSNEETLTSEEGSGSITLNESVISNLQMEFEKIAAEAGMDTSSAVTFDSPVTQNVPKKRKRAKSIDGQASHGDGLFGEGVVEGSAVSKSGEKSAKKVRFSMKNNLVWKPQTPLPPQSLRVPPSATPRGSALKKGVPAGPVLDTSTSSKKAKRRSSSLKKARKGLKSVSPSVKRLKKLRPLST